MDEHTKWKRKQEVKDKFEIIKELLMNFGLSLLAAAVVLLIFYWVGEKSEAYVAVAVILVLVGVNIYLDRDFLKVHKEEKEARTKPAYTRATRRDFESMVEKSQLDVAKAQAEVERLRGEIAAFERDGVQGDEQEEEYRNLRYELSKAEGHLDICQTCLRRDRETLDKWDRDGRL